MVAVQQEQERSDPIQRLMEMRQRDNDHTQTVTRMYQSRRNAMNRYASTGGGYTLNQQGGGGRQVGASADLNEIQNYARQKLLGQYGGSDQDWDSLYKLWMRESSWNPGAVNPSSGAFGIAQILPEAHPDVPRNLSWQQQIDWGLNYIRERYGNASRAWDHSERTNWY